VPVNGCLGHQGTYDVSLLHRSWLSAPENKKRGTELELEIKTEALAPSFGLAKRGASLTKRVGEKRQARKASGSKNPTTNRDSCLAWWREAFTSGASVTPKSA
jgi:hypothetical protein